MADDLLSTYRSLMNTGLRESTDYREMAAVLAASSRATQDVTQFASLAQEQRRLEQMLMRSPSAELLRERERLQEILDMSPSARTPNFRPAVPVRPPPDPATVQQTAANDAALASERQKLQEQIKKKDQELKETYEALEAARKQSSATESQLQEQVKAFVKRTEELEELERKKHRLRHLLGRVSQRAELKLYESDELAQDFERTEASPAYVLAIDIRRSTELMLKARDPRVFATFLTDLTDRFQTIILENHGVFDKFTGDGALAFFPEFFSGPDAGYLALKVATECHEEFTRHYAAHRHCFVSVLKDVGLGIGLDYGGVHIVFAGGQITVVGAAVVYACRMGGAQAGTTYVNQPAVEQLRAAYPSHCDFEEIEINIKGEGPTVAYRAALRGKRNDLRPPPWSVDAPPETQAAVNGTPTPATEPASQPPPPSPPAKVADGTPQE